MRSFAPYPAARARPRQRMPDGRLSYRKAAVIVFALTTACWAAMVLLGWIVWRALG